MAKRKNVFSSFPNLGPGAMLGGMHQRPVMTPIPSYTSRANQPKVEPIQPTNLYPTQAQAVQARFSYLQNTGFAPRNPQLGYQKSDLTFQNQYIIVLQLNFNILQQFNKIMMNVPPYRKLDERELLNLIRFRVYNPLIQFMFGDIEMKAPEDTGRLRDAMRISLKQHSQTASLNPFYVVINTGGLTYVRFVNEMPNEWLQHPGSHGIKTSYREGRRTRRSNTVRNRRGGRALYDPYAEHHWFNNIVKDGRNYAQQLYLNLLTSNDISRIFSGIAGYLGVTPRMIMQSLIQEAYQ